MGSGIDRREFLKSAVWSFISAGVGMGCSFRLSGEVGDFPEQKRNRLKKVNISRDRILHTVVGLRPYRPSGFVIKTETLDGKTIVHHYGHGGGGISLSWGTAFQAIEKALESGQNRYAVLGCGCIGLATARLLQDRGLEATIYAKDFPPNTTSDAAGALWGPVNIADYEYHTPEFMKKFMIAARISHRYFLELGTSYGIRWIENYSFSDYPPKGPIYSDIFQDFFPDYRILRKDEYPLDFPYACSYKTLLIEMPIYTNAILRDFLRAGGKLVQKEFKSLDEVIALPEPVVMNCTGIGAKSLFGDEELIPIKGQLIILSPQPEIDYSALTDGLYMIPRRDGILLGGTYERGEWTLEPNEEEIKRVMYVHTKFFKDMK